jgi:acyl-CoA reductase-like NAD-dependent aldehyde dehydrogenase
MGKPITQSFKEVDDSILRAQTLIRYAYNELREETVHSCEAELLKVRREPVGLGLLITPFTTPVRTTMDFLIPTLMAGNCALIKPSPYTVLCSLHFEEAAKSAGLEFLVNDCFVHLNTLLKIFEKEEIGFVAFEGSYSSGKSVLEEVTERKLIEVGLDLSGKDPAYVTEDADLDEAVELIVSDKLENAGQSGTAVSRVYVHPSIYDQFLVKAKSAMKKYVIGDPMKTTTTLGPLTIPDSLTDLGRLVRIASV